MKSVVLTVLTQACLYCTLKDVMSKDISCYARNTELKTTEKQLKIHVLFRVGLQHGTSGFQVQCPIHSFVLPPLRMSNIFWTFYVAPKITLACKEKMSTEVHFGKGWDSHYEERC